MAYKYNYIVGQIIGKLEFICRMPNINKKTIAKFKCSCGKKFDARVDSVKIERIKSCGCKTNEMRSETLTQFAEPVYEDNGILKIPELPTKAIHRFWNKVAITANPNLCWNWIPFAKSYGEIRLGQRMYKAHRVAYFLYYNKQLGDLDILHSCDNPKCCNPAHLSLGTHYDNMQDMKIKGRAKKKNVNQLIENQ